ncbi:UDP-2,3-diacylglucosamine diphosphatase, partial [Rhizobium leguminosarum]|nr:UDP-2,3-diacylglucosamine diphosphatase [Rhizobium leguminosarum]
GKLELLHWSESPIVLAKEPDAPNPDVCGDARPVIDTLPTAFVEQVNRLAS